MCNVMMCLYCKTEMGRRERERGLNSLNSVPLCLGHLYPKPYSNYSSWGAGLGNLPKVHDLGAKEVYRF